MALAEASVELIETEDVYDAEVVVDLPTAGQFIVTIPNGTSWLCDTDDEVGDVFTQNGAEITTTYAPV